MRGRQSHRPRCRTTGRRPADAKSRLTRQMVVKCARWPTAVIALALCGCATTTSLDPVPASAPVQFEAAAAADPKFSVGVSGPAKLRAVNTGAAVGAAIGALIGASLCGSAFLVCSPFLALAFAPIGAIVALVFGNTETLTPGLTQGLTRALEVAAPTTRPHDDVVAGARDAQRWSMAGGNTPVTRVVVRIDEEQLRAVTERRSHVALRGRVEAVAKAARRDGAGISRTSSTSGQTPT